MIGFDDPEYGYARATDRMRRGRDLRVRQRARRASASKHPHDDLVSVLMHAEVDGERPHRHASSTCFFMLLAGRGQRDHPQPDLGRDARPDRAPRSARPPAGRPRAPARARSRRCCAGCRRSSTSGARRSATPSIRGQQIREGDKVVIFYASANRDEDDVPGPGRFDIARHPERAPGLRHRPALLPRRQPGAARDPGDVRGAPAPAAGHRARRHGPSGCGRTSSTASSECRCGSRRRRRSRSVAREPCRRAARAGAVVGASPSREKRHVHDRTERARLR